VDTGSREENASNQEPRVFHCFHETVKDSSWCQDGCTPSSHKLLTERACDAARLRDWSAERWNGSGHPA